jgi:OFA family oxalate/formate antiporter-like MFS transporter
MSIMNRWTVVVAAVVMQLGLGSLYAWSVFRQPLSAHYGASVTGVNVAFFVAIFVFGISTLAAGFLLRHVGPRVVGVAGGVLFGTGVFLSAFAEESLPFLYFTYGVVAAVGGGLGYMVSVAVLPKWLPDKPGLAYGLAVVGFGIGPVINVPLISTILSATGGPFRTFGVLGLSYAALIGGAAWFDRNPPEDHEPLVLDHREQGQDAKPKETPYDLRRALRTWQWYALWGHQDIGAIYGGILTASAVAGFGAPLLLARSADVTGSYGLALYVTGGLMLIGTVIPLALRAPRPAR